MVLKVAPSLLSADFAKLGQEIESADKAGADWFHLDVMDGRFVPNLTMGIPVLESIRKATNKPFDVHLMIEEPERYVEAFRKAGGDRINVHVEATRHLHRCLRLIRDSGALAGAALNPSTPLSSVESVLPDLDQLLIMTVNPGFGGQAFIESMLPKIRAAKELLKRHGGDRPLEVVVDGGIDPTTARLVERAGATVAVAGSAVFKSPDYRKTIEQIKGRQGVLTQPTRAGA